MEQRVYGTGLNPEGATLTDSKFDRVKNAIADKLHDAADTIREKTASADIPAGLDTYGHQASSILDHSADYIRDFDIKQADQDLQRQIRNKPGASVLIAFGAGLLIGILFRRR
jgi:ElaB/YqjD/DUF883 family membrane-anchored ribosome-binding protein